MPKPKASTATKSKPTGWRRHKSSDSAAQRAWQTTAEEQTYGRKRGRGGQRVRVAIYASFFAILAGWFLYELIHAPMKTPVVAALAIDYRWPLPPNAWAREDIEGLTKSLGEQTLSVREVDLGGAAVSELLKGLVGQIDRATSQAAPGGAVVVYLSGHGAVDGGGAPCLLPANADPVDANTWLRLGDLLEQIKSIKSRHDVHYLLVVDANRQDENWSIGLLQNAFAARLAETVANAAVPRLAVINSTSEGEIARASPRLRGSVFGYYLQLGLAGAAGDGKSGHVNLRELASYLDRNVSAWTIQHRAAQQRPQLIPANAADFQVSWSLNAIDLARLAAVQPAPDNRDLAAASTKLDELWKLHEQISQRQPQHYAAWNWQQIEHELLWLEQAAIAGDAYKPAFEEKLKRVDAELNRARDAATGSFAAAKFAAALAGDDSIPLGDIKTASRPLAEYLGNAAGQPPERFSTQHFATLVDHYGVDRLWPDAEVKSKGLALYEQSEQLAVPQSDQAGENRKALDDLRAQALIRPLLDPCDTARRAAEDGLFLGPEQAPGLAKALEQCRQHYEEVGRVEGAFAEAYQARDRAWAELPYLSRWAAWMDNAEAESPANDKQQAAVHEKDKLLAMIDAADRLDATLRDAEKLAAEGNSKDLSLLPAKCSENARAVSETTGALRGQIEAAARRLPLARTEAKTLREMETVLSSPLVSGNARNVLRGKYIDTLAVVDGMNTAAGEPSNGSKEAPAEIPEVAHWQTHPLAVLLGSDKAQIATNQHDLAALGEKLRSRLLHVEQAPAADNATNLADADRALRQLVCLAPAGASNPSLGIERRQLQDLVLWHSARVLDDFWGSPTPGREPFFAESAEAYLVGARLLARPDPVTEHRMQGLVATWQARRRAAAAALSTTATDLVLIDAQSAATAQVSVRPSADAAGLPPGAAAVYLREDVAPIPQTVHRLDVGPEMAERRAAVRNLNVTVDPRELANRSTMLQAVVMFRGHEFPAPLMLRDVAGRRIEVDRHQYASSRVTVRGDRVKRASIVFILDCSHSMEDPVPVEGPDSPGRIGQRAKLDVAVDALENMLTRLGEQGDVRVGVRFFGHRVGWRTDKAETLARQESYPGGVPPTLRPYEDVELFLPLGRFDANIAASVAKRLHALKPWGESPIYLSLIDALKDFGPEDAQGQQRVVVITDGMNYQFNPPPESSPPLKDVEDAYARRGISVDIVGFGIPDEERLTAVKEFTQLGETSHGSFTLAMNASALVRRLEQLMVKTQFNVVNDAGGTLQQADLGGTVSVAASQSKPLDCDIDVDDLRTHARLLGGEALQLFVSRLGRRILCPAYEDDGPIFAPLVTAEPTSPSGYRAGAHRARPESSGVLFPISFQREDENIPQRPAQVWIEIVPQIPNRATADEGYIFYDENFEGDMPVPVMHCHCGNWPKEANQGAVRVWCSDRPIEPEEVVLLAKVADQTPPSGEGFVLKSVAGVTYQVHTIPPTTAGGRTQIRVVERHRPGVPVNAVKVELYPPPRHILHQFDAEHGIVLHTFELDPPQGKIEIPPELRFTSRARFTDAAWRTEQPLVLGIARQSEVILPPRLLDSRGQ